MSDSIEPDAVASGSSSPPAASPEEVDLTAPAEAFEWFDEATPLAERYVEILATRGVEWGLIGPRESGRLWDRHVLNSLAVSDFVPEGAAVVDVGSGAGLPGIPLALARPDLMITLLEPLERRATFLQLAVDELGLGERVRVVRGRAEDHREAYDVVTCRAVASLTKLLAWTAPLFVGGGKLVALKGQSAPDEVKAAAKELKKRTLRAAASEVVPYVGAEPTWVIVVA